MAEKKYINIKKNEKNILPKMFGFFTFDQ